MPPSSVSNAQIWERLGALAAGQDAMRDELRRNDANARTSRDKLYERLEDHGQRLSSIEDDVKEMRPTVKGLTDLRTKAGGVILVLGIAGTIIGLILSAFLDEIKHFVFKLLGY